MLIYKYVHNLRFIVPNTIAYMRDRQCSSRLNNHFTIDVSNFCANRRENMCTYNICARAFNLLSSCVISLPLTSFKRVILSSFHDVIHSLQGSRIKISNEVSI